MEAWLYFTLGAAAVPLLWLGPRWLGRATGELIGKRALHLHTHGNSVPPSTGHKTSPVSLKADTAGLHIVECQPPTGRTLTLPWSEVALVAVYKKDLYVVDTVMLAFRFANGSELEFSEDTEGWSDLAQGLHQHLPGCIPFHEWFMSVAFPAFQTNFAEIFKRGSASQVEHLQ